MSLDVEDGSMVSDPALDNLMLRKHRGFLLSSRLEVRLPLEVTRDVTPAPELSKSKKTNSFLRYEICQRSSEDHQIDIPE